MNDLIRCAVQLPVKIFMEEIHFTNSPYYLVINKFVLLHDRNSQGDNNNPRPPSIHHFTQEF
jgi:hypothetical protein